MAHYTADDNKIILEEFLTLSKTPYTSYIHGLLIDRLKFGYSKYNHGVIISDDTKKYNTEKNSWLEMFQEEALDGIVYIIAAILKLDRSKIADNPNIKKNLINALNNLLNSLNDIIEIENEFKNTF